MRRGVAIVCSGLGVVAILAQMTMVGCASRGELDGGPRYPQASTRVETLDIHAFRDGTNLRLTNTTGRSFGPGMVWINGRYGHPIDGLAVGQTLRLPMRGFVDEQGRRFGAGGFFAAEPPELLALVEFTLDADQADQPTKFGLIAVGQRR